MRASFITRVRIIAVALTVVAFALAVQLYLLQVVHGEEYRQRAENQHIRPSANLLSRGKIYFTRKDGTTISAATVQSGFTIALQPPRIQSAEASYSALQSIIPDVDRGEFMAKAAKSDDPYEELLRRVDEEKGQAILEAEIPGVQAYRERWRDYPGGTLAAHEIGFLGFGAEGTAESGQSGLERTYNTALSRPESGLSINFFADLFTSVGSRLLSDEAGPGADLVTSIEPSVQAHLEEVLRMYNRDWSAKTVGGIIMDPQTGQVIAMAALPTFDPNDVRSADPEALANPLVERVYEFGSTMKPITVASALDAGAITPRTTYNDTGFITVDTAKISNFDGKARGVVGVQEILSQSLNVGISFVVQKMGTKTLAEYFGRFGITEETGIDLPGEASPLVSGLESPRTVEYVTAGFGQGVAVTPIAMTRALATLANHGEVPSPHVGIELQYPGGVTKSVGWAPPRTALKPESAEAVTRMLVAVVDTALKNGKARVPEMTIAAKTGTAQIANPEGGGYYKDRYLHSFFGYFPAYDAEFLIFFFAVEPVGAQYASETWTDPFIDMTTFLTTYYQIPPDRAQD